MAYYTMRYLLALTRLISVRVVAQPTPPVDEDMSGLTCVTSAYFWLDQVYLLKYAPARWKRGKEQALATTANMRAPRPHPDS